MGEAGPIINSSGEIHAAAPVTTLRQRRAQSKADIKTWPASRTGPNRSDSSSSSEDKADVSLIKRRKIGSVLAILTAEKAKGQDHSGPATVRADRHVLLFDTNDTTKRKDWYAKLPKTGLTPASNIWVTTVTEFNLDVCRDYRRTGWYDYGDSCLFLHDRCDVKQGSHLDREWEDATQERERIPMLVLSLLVLAIKWLAAVVRTRMTRRLRIEAT